MSSSSVNYAENVLGVHNPWSESLRRLESHRVAGERIASIKTEIRNTKASVDDRRLSLISEAPAKYPDLSITARKDQLRIDFAHDAHLIHLEQEVRRLEGELDSAEAERRHHELGLHILTARMNELGGLLNFYAEAKAAAGRKKHLNTMSTGSTNEHVEA